MGKSQGPDISEILKLHRLWLDNDPSGKNFTYSPYIKDYLSTIKFGEICIMTVPFSCEELGDHITQRRFEPGDKVVLISYEFEQLWDNMIINFWGTKYICYTIDLLASAELL